MLSPITSNRNVTNLEQQSRCLITIRRQQWEAYNSQAYAAHKANKHNLAVEFFSKSLAISKLLQEHFFSRSTSSMNSGIAMMYTSSHNLAASLNSQHKALDAKEILLAYHNSLIKTLLNQRQSKQLRLESLAFLDKSLFSVSSQLAYINEVESIHNIILQTEGIANVASKNLLGTE